MIKENIMYRNSKRDLQEEYSYYLGKTVEIFDMEGEPQYAGKRGVVDYVDSIGQLHGTWGGCALIPGVDDFKIVDADLKESKAEDAQYGNKDLFGDVVYTKRKYTKRPKPEPEVDQYGGRTLFDDVEPEEEKKEESKLNKVNRLDEKTWKYKIPENLAKEFALAIDKYEPDYEELRNILKEIIEFVKDSVGEDNFYEDNLIEDLENVEFEDEEEADFYINEMYDVLDGYDVWMEPAINFQENRTTRSRRFVEHTEDTKVKEWYQEMYPTDDLGEEINDDITFYDVFRCLDNYGDIYDFLGVGDSLVRERVFEELAQIMGVDYDYVYEQWLRAK